MNVDIKQLCRTCVYCDTDPATLVQITSELIPGITLANALTACAPVKVSESDGLPQNMCPDCANSLRIAHIFQNQCIRAQEMLEKLLSSPKTPAECDVKIESTQMKTETSDYEDNNVDLAHDQAPVDEEDSFPCPIKLETQIAPTKEAKIVESARGAFMCHICKEVFRRSSSFDRHIRSHEKIQECIACHKKLISEKSMREHIASGICSASQIIKNQSQVSDEVQSPECNKKFKNAKKLSLHTVKHKNSKICEYCKKTIYSNSQLIKHLQSHGIEVFECDLCSRKFATQAERDKHEATHSKPNICPFCNRTFSQLCNLKDHMRTHTGETPYLCCECGKSFNNSSNLRQHMRRHTGLKPFQCSQCPSTFSSKGQLTSHISTHSGEHPFACEICPAKFTKPNSLKQHKLLHLGIKPYQCDVCGRRFSSGEHLKRHNRIHTGEKPYKCTYCSRAFTQSYDLTKHLRCHVGQNVHECSICSMRFRLVTELKRHYPTHYVSGKLSADNLKKDHVTSEDLQTADIIRSTTPQLNDVVGSDSSKTLTLLRERSPCKGSNVSSNGDVEEGVVIEE